MLHEYLILMLDLAAPCLVAKKLSLEPALFVVGCSRRRCYSRDELLLPRIDVLDGHQPLPMFLVVVLDLDDLHEAVLVLHLNNNKIKVNIKSESLLAQHASAGLESAGIVEVGTPSFLLLLHEGTDMEEEVISLGMLLGLVNLVLFPLELADVVVVLVDLVQLASCLDVFSEVQEVGVHAAILFLSGVVDVLFCLVCAGVLLGLFVAVEVSAILGVLLPGDESFVEHLF